MQVRIALKAIDSREVELRTLGSKRIRRFPITSRGPNEQWSCDGHDKLERLGFGIYGIRDVYSGYIISMEVLPSNRLAKNIQWVYVTAVLRHNGILTCCLTDGVGC